MTTARWTPHGSSRAVRSRSGCVRTGRSPGPSRWTPKAPPCRPRTAPVVHAPTPSDEPLGVPALLIASLPAGHHPPPPAPGPLTDFLVQRAADCYAELLAGWEPVWGRHIDLVPGPLGKGELDGVLRQAILQRLPGAFLAPAVRTSPSPVGSLARSTAKGRPRCVPWTPRSSRGPAQTPYGCSPRCCRRLLPAGLERRVELRTLGVGRLPLGDAIDRLGGAGREPAWWRRLYESLAGSTRTGWPGCPCRSPRGVRQSAPGRCCCRSPRPPPNLARLGLKVAHPDAAHPLLEKLGALPATPRAVLTTPQVRAAVAASMDEGEMYTQLNQGTGT